VPLKPRTQAASGLGQAAVKPERSKKEKGGVSANTQAGTVVYQTRETGEHSMSLGSWEIKIGRKTDQDLKSGEDLSVG